MNVFKTYFLDVITKNYVNFHGRVSRKQFWLFMLFMYIFLSIFIFIRLSAGDGALGILFAIVLLLFCLAMILPGLGIAARRLHDTNRSGWWQLIALLPFIGIIILLVFLVLPSTQGQNRFGTAK